MFVFLSGRRICRPTNRSPFVHRPLEYLHTAFLLDPFVRRPIPRRSSPPRFLLGAGRIALRSRLGTRQPCELVQSSSSRLAHDLNSTRLGAIIKSKLISIVADVLGFCPTDELSIIILHNPSASVALN